MLKIVIFDSGYGGELFADQFKEELPVVEVIRVIDWRHAAEIQSSPKRARQLAEAALRPYINKVDLIIFANHLLSITSLNYFRRKYKTQQFLGFELKSPDTYVKRDVLILATKPVAKTFAFRDFVFRLKRRTKTILLDSWPAKIDDGILDAKEIHQAFSIIANEKKFHPDEIILACAHFNDLKENLRDYFGHNIKIYDSFNDAIYRACKILKLRGSARKSKK